MVTKVERWGNSLGVRIPKAVAHSARVEAGITVRVVARDGQVILTPAGSATWSLATLLARVTRKNLHTEVEVGEPVGREVW